MMDISIMLNETKSTQQLCHRHWLLFFNLFDLPS